MPVYFISLFSYIYSYNVFSVLIAWLLFFSRDYTAVQAGYGSINGQGAPSSQYGASAVGPQYMGAQPMVAPNMQTAPPDGIPPMQQQPPHQQFMSRDPVTQMQPGMTPI